MSIKANIIDDGVLKNIRSRDVIFYLSKKGWLKNREIAGTVIFDSPDDSLRVCVPLEGGLEEDYILSMSKLISSVAIFEGHSQLDIVENFDIFSIGDIVRVRSENPLDIYGSTLPFNSLMALINNARQALLSGASLTNGGAGKPFLSSRKPQKVIDYINSLRFGQTERGSYIIKVISPLPEELKESNQRTLPIVPDASPFERVAVENTFSALHTLKEVLLETKKNGKFYFEPFLERMPFGVNADLCESIICKTDKGSKMSSAIDFSVEWSPDFTIPVNLQIPERISFGTDLHPYLEKAAEEFRKKEPEEISINGIITNLGKELVDSEGVVSIATIVGGKIKKVRAELSIKDYQLAISAHRDELEVYAIGRLNNRSLEVVSFGLVKSQNMDIFEIV